MGSLHGHRNAIRHGVTSLGLRFGRGTIPVMIANMPQTAGCVPAAATEAALKQGTRRQQPVTPTTKQHSRGDKPLGRAAGVDKTGADTGRTGKNIAGGKAAQARDAKGRFAKVRTKQQVHRAEIEVAKMKAQRTQLEKDITRLERALEEASPEWGTTQKKNNLKALNRIARDFDWLASMIRKAKAKMEHGSRSQREWAKRELPKYEERHRAAGEARVALSELNVNTKVASPESTQDIDELNDERSYWQDRARHWKAKFDAAQGEEKANTQELQQQRDDLEKTAAVQSEPHATPSAHASAEGDHFCTTTVGKMSANEESVVLEDVIDENYEPTEDEILEYAKWLGMCEVEDKHLFWIAREALKAPLPENWKPCKAPDGEIYFFNFKTEESMWDHPNDERYQKLYEKEKKKT